MTNNKKKHRKNAAGGATTKRVGFNLPDDAGGQSSSSSSSSKKKSGGTQKADGSGASTIGSPSISGSGGPGSLSKGQLAVLIVVSLGISRLLQVGSAAHAEPDPESNDLAPSPECVSHLGEAACQQSSIRALLKYKFFTGVKALMVVAAAIAPCWRSEPLLQTFGMVLIALLGAFGTVLLSSPGLLAGGGSNALMCLVLTAVALPSESLPRRRLQYKTLQSLCLFTMAAQWAAEAVSLMLHQHYYFHAHGSRKDADAAEDPVAAVMILRQHPADDSAFWDAHKAAVDVIVNFVAFDKCAMALVLLFAWYYLPNANQRTVLLSLALLQAGEYGYRVPPEVAGEVRLPGVGQSEDDYWRHDYALLLGALWCGLAWIAPELRWKRRL